MARLGQWAKWGCLGCAGLVAILALIGAIFAGLGWAAARNAAPVDVDVDVDTPRAAAPAPAEPAGPAPIPAGPPGDATATPPPVAGVVTLDLADAGFAVVPAPAGEPLQVRGRYDENAFALTHEVEDGPPWHATIRFRSTRSGLVGALAQMFGGDSPEIRIHLPRDVRLDLDVTVRSGALETLEIGGLDVNVVDATVERGAIEMSVSEPLRHPAERISVSGAMFGGVVRRVGNASARELEFNANMGGLMVDLRGAWRRDATIELSSRMSGLQVQLPEGVDLEGVDDPRFELPDPDAPPRPTLTFRTDGSEKKGRIEFRR